MSSAQPRIGAPSTIHRGDADCPDLAHHRRRRNEPIARPERRRCAAL